MRRGIIDDLHQSRRTANTEARFEGDVEVGRSEELHRREVCGDLDVRPAGRREKRAQAFGIGKGHRPGGVGIWRRLPREQLGELPPKVTEDPVLARLLPADKGHAGRNICKRAYIGERGDRIIEEHHSEAREHCVDRATDVDRGGGLGVAEHRRSVTVSPVGQPSRGQADHGPADVEADHPSGLPDGRSEVEGGRPAATADVNDRLAGLGAERSERGSTDDGELTVHLILQIDPSLPSGRRPELGLDVVPRCCRGHVNSPMYEGR